jgi:eukaryotic-like serine/threonine-protein kinase
MDIEREQRVLKLFEEALDWPASARTERLESLLADEPDVLSAVLAMLKADHAATFLPTEPPGPSAIVDDTPMPERIGNYRIIEEIGRGGMGLVYRAARDDGLFDQQVAIKIIRRNIFSATTQEQFANERRILARLHHPHIAHLLDGGVTGDGTPYIIMELINGVPITEFAMAKVLDLSARLALFGDACAALEYAHRELIVHADVKPSNVVIAEGFGVKLLDFGIARLVGEDGGRAALAHTPGYSSPARLSGERSTPTDDVFALGVLLHELISGVEGADDDLRAIVAKAAEKDANGRYGAVSALSDDIARWQRHEPVFARPPDRLRRGFLFWRRNRLAVAAGALLLVTALATTFLYIRASAARATAEQRFAETRSLSNYLVSDVVKDLESMPGTGPLRQQIAERARLTLENLSKVPGASIELQVETANAYARVGEILASEDLRDVMDPATGDAVLARAEAMVRALRIKMPERGDLELGLARTLLARASFQDLAKADQARTFAVLDEIAKLSDPAIARDPADFSAQIVRLKIDVIRGYSYSRQSDYKNAIAMAEKALKRAAGIRTTTVRQRADVALMVEQSHTLIGDSVWYGGDPPGALVHYERGKAVVDEPALGSDIRILKRRGFDTYTVASSLFALGQPQKAVAMSEAGLAALERLRQFDDSASVRRTENIVREEYSYELQNSGRLVEAYRQNDIALAGYRDNARMQPNNYQVQRALPAALRPSGEMYRDTGDPAKGCERFREADALWTRFAKQGLLSKFDADNDVKLIKARLAKCPAL